MAEVMPLIPLRGLTVYPDLVIHFDLGREKSIVALERAMMMNQTVFLATQKNAEIELPTLKDIYNVGTVAVIKQMIKLPDGNIRILVDGQYRARLVSMVSDSPYFLVNIQRIEIPEIEMTTDVQALMRTCVSLFEEYASLNPRISKENRMGLDEISSPGRLADIAASGMNLKTSESQKVLASIDPVKRLQRVVKLLTRETEAR